MSGDHRQGDRRTRPAAQQGKTANETAELSHREKNVSDAPRVPDGRALGGVARGAWLERW
jgi:hypothetical protein